MSLEGKSVLIAGGAGFIGSHFVDRLVTEGPSRITIVDNFFLGSPDNLTSAVRHVPTWRLYGSMPQTWPQCRT